MFGIDLPKWVVLERRVRILKLKPINTPINKSGL